MNPRYLFSFELQPGMICDEDVHSIAGHPIADKDTILTDEIIQLIRLNNITGIKVKDKVPNVLDRPITTASYMETPKYKEFHHDFTDIVDTFNNSINDVVNKNQPIDVDVLSDKCNSLLNQTGPGLELFNMLHCMKEFNDSTYTHSINVALIATMLGRWLNLSEKELDTLMLCGIFHDIGKLVIPDNILNKPGRLTDSEYAIIKKHSVGGYNILKDRQIDAQVKEACLLHHERCDGKGYPFGLKGSQIPDVAKIISIADVYDAMTAKRCYHDPICPFKVISALEDDAFTKFDPRFITTFLSNVSSTYINNSVRLSDNRVGEIIMSNTTDYAKPVVKCNNDFIDLSRTPGLEIVEVV